MFNLNTWWQWGSDWAVGWCGKTSLLFPSTEENAAGSRSTSRRHITSSSIITVLHVVKRSNGPSATLRRSWPRLHIKKRAAQICTFEHKLYHNRWRLFQYWWPLFERSILWHLLVKRWNKLNSASSQSKWIRMLNYTLRVCVRLRPYCGILTLCNVGTKCPVQASRGVGAWPAFTTKSSE